MREWLPALLLFGAVLPVSAGFRVWTATDGSSITAEFQSRSGNKVCLVTENGRKFDVPFERLSKEDRAYAELHSPPRLEVEVDPNENHVSDSVLNRSNEGYIVFDFEVQVFKKSMESYSRPLRVDLYVVGTQEVSGRYVVLRHFQKRLVFPEAKNRRTISFDQLLLRQTPAKDVSEADYCGYLLVVADERDERIAVASNRKEFENNAERFGGVREGAVSPRDDIRFSP